MITLNVKGLTQVTSKLKNIKTKINRVPDEAFKVFVVNTPVRSGNARRNTKLKGKRVIEANYPYAKRLDEGHSKQSPKGMVQPTIDFIRKRVKQILAGK